MKSKHLLQDDGFSHAVDVVAYDGSDVVWELNVYDDICDAFKEAAKEVGISIKWGAAWSEGDIRSYEGTAEDVIGKARGFSYGPIFKFEYVLLVPVKGRNIKITFDDWIFMQDDKVAINRATMTKFGIKVAELTVMFFKD